MNPIELLKDLPTTPLGLLSLGLICATIVAVKLIQAWMLRKAGEYKLAHSAHIATHGLSAAQREAISKHEPPDPPATLGILMLLMLGGAVLSLLVASGRGELRAWRRVAPMELIEPASACADCSRPGCKCSGSVCSCGVDESSALTERPSSVLGLAPWFNEPVQAWAERR